LLLLERGAEAIEPRLPEVAVLAALPPEVGAWEIRDLTPDAGVVVGVGRSDAGDVPFRWSSGQGLQVQVLGELPADATGAIPLVVSENGAAIAGVTTRAGRAVQVFYWSAERGLNLLVQAHELSSEAGRMRLTADGALVFATVAYPDPSIANVLRWGAGLQIIGDYQQNYFADANADGSLALVGYLAGGGYVWQSLSAGPINPLAAGSESTTVPLSASAGGREGWQSMSPQQMSEDGRVIFGQATCGGTPIVYRQVLPR